MKHILIVDDELGSRESLRAVFRKKYKIQCAENAIEAMDIISKNRFDLVILDVVMPGMNGLAFLKEIREVFPEIPVVMISASCTDTTIQEAKELKAIGFICKPFDVTELRSLVDQTLQASVATRQQTNLTRELARNFPCTVIGESPAMKKAIEDAQRASHTNGPVLLIGEQGTGRELLARQIHSWSNRSTEPLIKMECASHDDISFESEIYGHVQSSTDSQIHPGTLDMAAAGAIFLDKFQVLSTPIQDKLIKAIATNEFERYGATTRKIPHGTRFFASYDLPAFTDPAKVVVRDEIRRCFGDHIIYIPALRERRQDISVIASHLLGRLSTAQRSKLSSFEPEVLMRFQNYSWPGNVRELHNVLERITVLHGNEPVLKLSFLPPEIGRMTAPGTNPTLATFNEATEQLHRQMIIEALQESNGVLKKAATLLDLTPRILQLRMRKLNIDADSCIR